MARSRLTCARERVVPFSNRRGRFALRGQTDLEPSVLVAEVVCSRSRYEAELGRRAAVLALLVFRFDRQFVTPYPARQTFDPPQGLFRERSLSR